MRFKNMYIVHQPLIDFRNVSKRSAVEQYRYTIDAFHNREFTQIIQFDPHYW